MSRVQMRRPSIIVTMVAALVIGLVGFGVPAAQAASQGQYASGWSVNSIADWTPFPPSSHPLGAPDNNCVGGTTGMAWAEFTFPAFSLPASGVVTGIEISVNYRSSGTHFVQLGNGGSLIGAQKTLPSSNVPSFCSSTAIVTAGGAADLWGTSLTTADFNAGTVSVRLTEGRANLDLDSIELIVHQSTASNQPPTAEANGPYSVPEGGSVVLSSAGSMDPDGDPLTFDWDLDNNGSFETSGASPTFSAAGRNGPDSQTVVLRVSDGSLSDTDTATVNITNVAPTIDTILPSPASINEGNSVRVSGTFSDPGTGETHTGTALWSDGASTSVTVGAGRFFTDRSFPDDHPATATASDAFTVDITIDDGDGGSDTATSPVITVNNVAPVITSIASSATLQDKAEEGETVTVSGSFTDVGVLDTHVASVDWGDGNVTPGTVVQGAGSGTYSAGHVYGSGGVYTVIVTITDDDTGSTSASTQAVMTGVGINGGVLQIVGTADDDHVEVFIAGGEVDVFASFMTPRHTRFDPADVDSVEIWLCEGDDHGNVHQSITVDAVIHGDDGRDMLWGGDGNDFIEGGDGDDKIWGRRGDDELHGNDGNDRLTGGKGLDILDGGSGNNVLKQ